MKKNYQINVTLKSPCLIGSGEGFGPLIDSDIVMDDLGLPYIPAKRIKGCLRDSAIGVCEIFELAGIRLIDLSKDEFGRYKIVSAIFGEEGEETPAPVYFSNLTVSGHEEIAEWLRYLMEKHGKIINRESIINQYTEIRQQTAIDEKSGVAKEHSLRTIRVAKKGLTFEGKIDIECATEDRLILLSFSCRNLKHIGTKRNRGFGLIECRLLENSKEINFMSILEEICRQ